MHAKTQTMSHLERAYTELIDSWDRAVPYDPHFVADGDPEKARALFLDARHASLWVRRLSDAMLSSRVVSRVEWLLVEARGADTQARNGCEAWQAFLTVALLARIADTYPQRRWVTLSNTMACARRCLEARMGRAGFVPWLLSAELIVQVTQVDAADDTPCGQFTQQCIRSLVRRSLCSYAFMCEAHHALSVGVEAIEAGRVSNIREIQLHGALGIIEVARSDLEGRMLILIQGLHARLGRDSPFFLLSTDLMRGVVRMLKEGHT